MGNPEREANELRRTLARMELGIEGAGIGLWDHTLPDDTVIRNRRWSEMLGYEPGEIADTANAWRALIHPDDRPLVEQIAEDHHAGRTPTYRVVHRIRAKSGEWKWILNWGKVVERDATGLPTRAVGVHVDITEQKRAEQALRESELRFRELCDLLPQTVVELDLSGRITFVNQQGIEQHRLDPKSLERGVALPDLFAASEHARVRQRIYQMMRGEQTSSVEFKAIRADGTTYPALLYGRPIQRGGANVGSIATLVDITDRKRSEMELARADKLESIGTLAGGIAHDFNNILSAVLGNLSLARLETVPDSPFDSLLHEAEAAALRAREVTGQLLAFSRGGAPIRKPTSLPKLVEEAAKFALLGSNVRAEFDFDVARGIINVSEVQIHQVFNNLFLNASQATPNGGMVSVRCREVEVGHQTQLPLLPGPYLRTDVSDQGVGIDPNDLPRIFDPFFTTKDQGHGLGLATTYATLRRHDGHVEVSSALGEGTTFTVYLPASEGDATTEAGEDSHLVPGYGRILILEDESAVAKLMSRLLRRLGYEVEVTTEGSATVAAYSHAMEEDRPFDVILVDLTIPGGVGGAEVLKELLTFDPHVRAIVCSGYSNDPIMSDHERHGFIGRLEKPFRIVDLSRVIRRAMADSTTRSRSYEKPLENRGETEAEQT